MESRHASVIDELRRVAEPGDDDIRVAEGAAGGATRITGFRKLSVRTLAAITASHGFDASLCTHELSPTVVVELVNRVVHTAVSPVATSAETFLDAAKLHLGAAAGTRSRGGSCSLLTLKSNAITPAHALTDILASTRVVDIWAFPDKLAILYAGPPKHTSALTHLREQRPELFSPNHCRSLADRKTKFKA
jgi:hypothetical protein